MKYIVYKTTNRITGRFYIGKLGTRKADNWTYLGSGRALLADIAIYGRPAFRRETLFEFDNAAAARDKERELVTRDFCARPDTYNLDVGGTGTWERINKTGNGWVGSRKARNQIRRTAKETKERRRNTLRQRWAMDEDAKLRHKSGIAKAKETRGFWGAKKQTAAARARISKAMLGRIAKGRHPCIGTRWMNSDGLVVKVPEREIADYVSAGWLFGRK